MLFERCFKERIWALILYQLSTASKGGGYRTSTALRIHPSFNIRNGKKAACVKTKPPKRVGLPIPLQIPQLEVRTREIHSIRLNRALIRIYTCPYSPGPSRARGTQLAPNAGRGYQRPSGAPVSFAGAPTPLPSPPRGGATLSRRRPLLPTAGRGRSKPESGWTLPRTRPRPPSLRALTR